MRPDSRRPFDMRPALEAIGAALEKAEKPSHRAMLENLRDHFVQEGLGEIDELMKLMVPTPEHHFFVRGGQPQKDLYGEEIREFYVAKAKPFGGIITDLEIEHLAVGDWCIALEGWSRVCYPGSDIPEGSGLAEVDPEGVYAVTVRLAAFFPYDPETGLLIGENSYGTAPLDVRKLEQSEVPTPQEVLGIG